MAQKYYNVAETAKLLGKTADEVKKMLERHELHGYRDGADWKFKVEDIDRLVGQPAEKPAEEGGGDVLLSEVALGQSDPGLSGTVIGMSDGGRLVTDSDVRLAADSDRVLDAAAKTPPKGVAESKFDDLNLSLESDLKLQDSKPSNAEKPAAPRGGGSSVIDLSTSPSDDELVLGGSSGTGSNVTLGGDSGISLVDPSDSGLSLETPLNLGPVAEESLELGEDDMLTTSETASESTPQLKTDDDFLLTPLDEAADTEESGSQVIALDTEAEEAGMGSGVSVAAMLDEDLATHSGLEMAATPAGAPILGGAPAAMMGDGPTLARSAVYESPFTAAQVTFLVICAVILLFCSMMMYDLLRNMWGMQGGPYPVNSRIMDVILHWVGL
jgi:excisionase family DNA binding protein